MATLKRWNGTAWVPVGADTFLGKEEAANSYAPVGAGTSVDALADASTVGKSVAKAANAAAIRTLIDAATPAQVTAAVNAVINAAPGTLDTLDELAQALGDDPNFATTITALIGAKYGKPVNGIPATDLVQAVRDSLGKADTALQQAAADLRYIRTVNAVGPDANGNVVVSGGGTGQADTVDTLGLTGATGRAVMKAADATTARTAIGAGTSNLELGTTASTAKPGDYQPSATSITDLTEFIQDTVAGLLKAGTNVTTAYDDAANTFTINATAGGGGATDPEVVRDTIGGALVAGSGISVTVDDAGDTITIAVAGIPQSSVTGLTTSLTTLQTNIDAKYTKPGAGIPLTDLSASGTRDATTYLRGDNTWVAPPSGSGATTVDALTDATPVGKSLVKATNAAAARDAIGAVNADFVTAAVGDKLIVARHGSNQTFARPVTSSTVLWIGTATPANRLANDLVFYVAATPVDPWTPAAVAGLHSWYDAISLGMLDAERVSQWNDRSPSPLNMTQATATQRPTYVASAINGMPAVRFDGTSWNMRGPTFAAYVGAWTVYMVATSSPASLTGSSDAFFDGAGASNAMLRLLYGRNTNGEWNPNRGVGFSAAGANNSPHVHRIVFNGTTSSVEIDGVTAGTGTTSLGGIDVTQLVLGMRGDSAQYLDGYLGELIFIKGTVPAEDAQIKEYLRTRWRFAA